MEIKRPSFKNTEGLSEIYSRYDTLPLLRRLEAAFDFDDGAVNSAFANDENGGTAEYMMDRVLRREGECSGDPAVGGNDDGNALMTRGRALYMYTHDVSVIGFGGRPSYCLPLEGGRLFGIRFFKQADATELIFSEIKEKRVNCPSCWHGEYECHYDEGVIFLTLDKFITHENCAVALLRIENKGAGEVNIVFTVSSPFTARPWAIYPENKRQAELRGMVSVPGGLSNLMARLTSSEANISHRRRTRPGDEPYQPLPWEAEPSLFREIKLLPGGVAYADAVMTFACDEIPAAESEYMRYVTLAKGDHTACLRAQKRAYNEFWHKTIPYIDVPNPAVKKAIDYRFWLERYNTLDADIPGHDFQYPVTIEGVLGYNNAIVLTQCMHLQDTKWQRTPALAYGQLLSVGSCSGGDAFLDNPGNRRCWNNHYGQYIAQAGLEAFYVHGGSRQLALTLARWFEGDAKGQLKHYANHESPSTPKTKLIAYKNNYMTGNDADTVSMHYKGSGRFKMHGENAYVYGAAKAAAELYALAGDSEKSAELSALAEEIRAYILEYLWCDKCRMFETRAVEPDSDFIVHNPDKPNLIPYKESNNYNYFSLGVAPTDDESLKKYVDAFRFLADPEEFPIFPYYTASQRDNKMCPGSNNFSNINFTVQLRAYEAALRVYDREHKYVTPEMLSAIVEWCAWNIYPDGGDVRYPNNSEFFNADRASDPTGKGDYYRSWIDHNILGNYIFTFVEDMAGLRPRADGKIELDPIDFGYGHFAVDNLRYHGVDISIIYNGDGAYDKASVSERGYSLYIDGVRAVTTASLCHIIYDPETGEVDLPSGGELLYSAPTRKLGAALDIDSFDKRTEELLSRAGITKLPNLALGAKVTASYTPTEARPAPWEEKHRSDGGDETSLAENECVPTVAALTDGRCERMPFWGNFGSTAPFDTLTLTLDEKKTFDTLVMYFYDDRQPGGYSAPRRYIIEYRDGDEWKLVERRSQDPLYIAPNRNVSRFAAVTSDAVRVHIYNKHKHFTAVTEIQLFYEGTERREVFNRPPEVLYFDCADIGGNKARLRVVCRDDGLPYDDGCDLTVKWRLGGTPEGAVGVIEDDTSPDTILTVSKPGRYWLSCNISDGLTCRGCGVTVHIAERKDEKIDVAPDARVTCSFCSDWERAAGVNDPKNEPVSSSMGTGRGWGTWGSRDKSDWIELTWPEPVCLDSADIFWYADGGGIKLPASFELEYENADGARLPVKLKTDVKEAISPDKYNLIEFTPITARSLRIKCVRGDGAVGIYRIKTYFTPVVSVDDVYVSVKTGVKPVLPSHVTAKTADGVPVSLRVVWFDRSLKTDADGEYIVEGTAEPFAAPVRAVVTARGDMDKATITTVDDVCVSTYAGEAPALPKFALVRYNNGAADNISKRIVWGDIPKSTYAELGTQTITGAGKIEGTDIPVTLTITAI